MNFNKKDVHGYTRCSSLPCACVVQVLVRGSITWRALLRWSDLRFWEKNYGPRTVPVEGGTMGGGRGVIEDRLGMI